MRVSTPPKTMICRTALAVMVAASCTTDDPDTEESALAPSPISAAASAVSAYDIVKVPAMTIDGNLNEWTNVAAISMADNSGRTGGVDNTAKVKLAWDETYLYAAYNITDTELLAVQTTRDNADIYKDDAVELYIDPQGDGASATTMATNDYQLLANVRDALGDARGTGTASKDESFNPTSYQAKAASNGTLNATGTDVGYTVELRISWSDLGITPAAGHFMRIDPAVDDRDGTGAPPVQTFDWAGLSTTYNNPSGWKDVQLVNPPPPVSAYDIVKVGNTGMTVDGNLSDWNGVPAVTFADDPARGAAANSASVKLAWNDTYLFAAYNVSDTELLALQTVRDHGDIYKDDEVELYIDPQGDGAGASSMTATDYQFLANVREAVGDNRGNGAGGKDASYNATSFVAKAVTDGTLNAAGTDAGYTVELRISWSDLGVTPAAGHFMRLDLAAGDRDGSGPPPVNEFDWAGLSTTYNNPGGWKPVKLVVDASAPATPTNVTATAVSSSQIDVGWTASTSGDVARYNIYRGTTGTPTLLTSVGASPYRDTALTAGTSYSYQVAAVDAAGNESPRTSSVTATTTGTTAQGIPFGPFNLWRSYTALKDNVEHFNLSHDSDTPGNIITRINSARNLGIKLMLVMTGGPHSLNYADGVNPPFHMPTWKRRMDAFDTPEIKKAIADGVTDGTIIGNSVIDEAHHQSWQSSTFQLTKAMTDEMCGYVKAYFPSLPVGHVTLHSWRRSEHYRVCDFIVSQYASWRSTVTQHRDSALAVAADDGIAMAFSLNILDGGTRVTGCPTDQNQTGGTGTFGPNCRMTAAQVENFGKVLGPAGSGLLMWRYDDAFMIKPENQAAFEAIAEDLGNRPAKGWRRR